MSYFYGSRTGGFAKSKDGRWRAHGMTRQVLEVLEERRKGTGSKSTTQDARQIAQAIYKTIGDMVPSAKAVMTFLRQLTKLYANEGKPLRWPSHLGQPIINCYYEPEEKDIEVKLPARSPTGVRYWRRRTVTMVIGDTDEFRTKKARNAAPANYVHSLDADHLKLVALPAKSEGIAMVSVHDCFGSLAPRFKRFNDIIREQFEVLHEPNLLEALLSSARATLPQNIKLPKAPERGTYDLKDVRGAPHSFK
jgi:DNA-directed RNA polymerase, mitochondrial